MNPVISAEVDALKSQLVGLVSGSIESKLNTLEEGLKAGTITEIGLDTIEALKDDLVVLKTYSETGAGRLIAQKYLQQANKAENKNLAQEVSQLRSMIYFLITSCGLMVAAVASVWVRRKYALIHDVDKQKKIS
jgi:ribosomal silencing factor RsfS